MEKKKIGPGKSQPAQHHVHNAIEVMKPFLSFGVKAMTVIGAALVTIVRNIPKPGDDKPRAKKDGRIIKI